MIEIADIQQSHEKMIAKSNRESNISASTINDNEIDISELDPDAASAREMMPERQMSFADAFDDNTDFSILEALGPQV